MEFLLGSWKSIPNNHQLKKLNKITDLKTQSNNRVPASKDLNCLLAKQKGLLIVDLHVKVFPLTVHRTILEKTCLHKNTDEVRVGDCNELDILTFQSSPSDQWSDPSKSVDSNLDLPHGVGLKLLER
nr:hypothetical protein Iba_chr08aCG3300 [Ipomoea batatas]